MDVFISWSGERSRAAAEALREWLPMVINAIEPWLSSADIDKGSRWATELSVRMEVSKAGIICLTPSNLRAEWVLFEAGALSKTITNTFVCPFLIDLKPTDLRGPLAQFQAVRATNKKEVLELIKTLNTAQEKPLLEKLLGSAFEMWWPALTAQLQNLPSEESTMTPQRSERELLEEILDLVRNQGRMWDASALTGDKLDHEITLWNQFVHRNERIDKEIRDCIISAGDSVSEFYTGTGSYPSGDKYYDGAQFNIRSVRTEKGKHYKFIIPIEMSLDEALDLVRKEFATGH